MGGKSFTIPCILSRNGNGVKTTALADTGANAFALIDTACAQKLSEFLDEPLETLQSPVPLRGFDGHRATPITQVLRCHLNVDQRRQYNLPFLVTDLGNHDVILGRSWMAYLDIWLDVRNRQLLWPASLPPTPSFVKVITRTMDSLRNASKPSPEHQADLLRREEAFQRDVRLDQKRIRILRRPVAAETAELSQEPASQIHKPSLGNEPRICRPWKPKNLGKRTERIDY